VKEKCPNLKTKINTQENKMGRNLFALDENFYGMVSKFMAINHFNITKNDKIQLLT